MAIYIDEQKKLFTLSTNNTSYQMMADKYLVLNHLYYGENIGQEDMSYLLDYQDRGFSGNPYEAGNERDYSLDSRPQEYSTNGVGDYRINSVSVINADGSDAADWRYAGYTIEKGKYAIPGMPALYGEEKDADTLIVELADKVTGLHAFLYYSVWEERDIITRCVKFVNQGTDAIVLTKAASMNLDLMSGDWELMHFHGRHNLERQMERVPLMRGKMTVESVRGASSHQHNPFAILCSKDTTEEAGPCYGTALVYSGNFSIEAEKDQMGQTRLTAGINSQRFAWTLEAGAEFWTPEAVMTYSSEGFGKMSANFHHT
ncbi:MAG: glycoside hydrolase family 36 N-terminal domain-containing protein, partial [Lachnospiraceae bacterium]|nr:glycoside hydrolase family 36 N-terminal domain-containing protein [Lachnospiraceae bacterium]